MARQPSVGVLGTCSELSTTHATGLRGPGGHILGLFLLQEGLPASARCQLGMHIQCLPASQPRPLTATGIREEGVGWGGTRRPWSGSGALGPSCCSRAGSGALQPGAAALIHAKAGTQVGPVYL